MGGGDDSVSIMVGHANTGTPSYADFNMVKLDGGVAMTNYFWREDTGK